MSKNAKTWLIILAVVLFLCLIVPEAMKGILLLLSFPIGMILFMCLIGGIQSASEKHSNNKYMAQEKARDEQAISALKYHSIQSRGEYLNGWARVKIAEHRYTYVKNVDGRDVFIKPDSRFVESYNYQLGKNVTTEYTDTQKANFFENAEEFIYQSAIVERDRKVALLGVDGQYVFPFNYGEGETLFSDFNKLDNNCLEYSRTFKNPDRNDMNDTETIYINRDGKIIYDGFVRNKIIENGCLVIHDGHYRMEIDLKSAKVVLPFCLNHFTFANGTKLIFSRKDRSGWNVYDPSCQKLLFEHPYGSIVYLDKQDSYLVIDDKTIGVANSNGKIIREFSNEEIKFIYDQRYLYGDYSLYDFDGTRIIGWPYHIREVIHDEEVSCDTVWWSTYIDPRDTPKQPPFTKMAWGRIMFIICNHDFCDTVFDLKGTVILGPINPTVNVEYDKETNKPKGFAYYLPWSKTWEHCSLDGKVLCKNNQLPSRKRAIQSPSTNITARPPITNDKTQSAVKVKKDKKFLFFDTETTGLPRNYNAPISDLENWPRLVQLSWIVTAADGKALNVKDFIIKPDGFTIPEESSKVHGITTDIAMRDGTPLQDVLTEFVSDLEATDMIVGHNVDFDKKIVGAEFLRCKLRSKSLDKPTVCTMKSSTNYCALPGKYGYKWPTLQELHNKLFGESFEDAHNSLNDIKATKKCFFELRERGIIC